MSIHVKGVFPTGDEPGSQPPLAGHRIVEIAGLGAAPYGAMLLADLGAEVIRVDRVSAIEEGYAGTSSMLGVARGRRSIALDLKADGGLDVLLTLLDTADVVIEPFRPGVAERLGFGPAACSSRNPRLVYVRMTGWGQEGPLSALAGHDINYLAVAGALHPLGDADRPPPPPLSYVGDLGGGGAFLAIGVCAALLERTRTGLGQVLDVAMVDGAASLTATFHGLMQVGAWSTSRGQNLADGSAPFYRCYACADGRFVAVGALEPVFYQRFVEGLGLAPSDFPQHDRAAWPAHRQTFGEVIRTRTRDDWASRYAAVDACVSPVLTLAEAPEHEHAVARRSFRTRGTGVEPAPAPRFSRTPTGAVLPVPRHGEDTEFILSELGYDADRQRALRAAGAVASPT